MELPPHFNDYPETIQEQIRGYLTTFTPMEQRAYRIAVEHLGTSFNIARTAGFESYVTASLAAATPPATTTTAGSG